MNGDAVKQYLAEIGRRGGSTITEKKRRAARRNAVKARKHLASKRKTAGQDRAQA